MKKFLFLAAIGICTLGNFSFGQKQKIDDLEKKLWELSKNIERLDKKEPVGVYQLRTT